MDGHYLRENSPKGGAVDDDDVFFIYVNVVEVLREQRNTPCSVQILEVRCKCSQ